MALRLCLDRIILARKYRPLTFPLPPITSVRDADCRHEAVATGHVTPSKRPKLPKLIDGYVRAYQTAELDERAARVEELTDAELDRFGQTHCGNRHANLPPVDGCVYRKSKSERIGDEVRPVWRANL
jgi:hypothetical protein